MAFSCWYVCHSHAVKPGRRACCSELVSAWLALRRVSARLNRLLTFDGRNADVGRQQGHADIGPGREVWRVLFAGTKDGSGMAWDFLTSCSSVAASS
jgi:hypothetical protein